MNRYLWPLIAVVALLVFLVMGLRHGDPRALPSPFIGKPAPRFELPTLKNPEVTIGSEKLAGEYALVNVWATWCVMCRAEHGFLLDLAASGAIPSAGSTISAIRTLRQRLMQMAGSASTGASMARPRPSWSILKVL
jgi:cytochrome c biogenesis protein CcmG/thiol:disulfide interchange protein DsbE